jgi:hypothetical protein
MTVRVHLPGYRWTRVFRNVAVRTGIYAGVGLIFTFTAWLFVANRMPGLEGLAMERNVVAASTLVLAGLIPVFRFLRQPGHLLASSLIAWLLLTTCYRLLCLHFVALGERYSTPQVFILGALIYMIVATLSWVGTCLWRVRESHVSESKPSPGLNPR